MNASNSLASGVRPSRLLAEGEGASAPSPGSVPLTITTRDLAYWLPVLKLEMAALDAVETHYFGLRCSDKLNAAFNRATTICQRAVDKRVEQVRDLGGLLLIGGAA